MTKGKRSEGGYKSSGGKLSTVPFKCEVCGRFIVDDLPESITEIRRWCPCLDEQQPWSEVGVQGERVFRRMEHE